MGDIVRTAAETREVVGTPSDGSIIEWFLSNIDVSPKSRETYGRSLRVWSSYLEAEGLSIAEADSSTVRAYKRRLREDGKRASTVNTYLTAVRRLYAACEARGLKANIAADVKGERKNPNSPKDALTVEEARSILADGPGEGAGERELRDYAMVNLLIRRGLRTVEVVRADVGDLRRVGTKTVLYVQGKGYADKGDFVVMDEPALAPIRRYLASRGNPSDREPLFASVGNRNRGGRMATRTVSRVAKESMRAHGIDSAALTAHSMRHTAVTLALVAGASLQEVQAMARHRNINTTTIYAHNLDRMEGRAEGAVDSILAV